MVKNMKKIRNNNKKNSKKIDMKYLKNTINNSIIIIKKYNSTLIKFRTVKRNFKKKSSEDPIVFYKILANRGDANAMYNYVRMLQTGDRVKQNKKEAAKYFKIAVDK